MCGGVLVVVGGLCGGGGGLQMLAKRSSYLLVLEVDSPCEGELGDGLEGSVLDENLVDELLDLPILYWLNDRAGSQQTARHFDVLLVQPKEARPVRKSFVS